MRTAILFFLVVALGSFGVRALAGAGENVLGFSWGGTTSLNNAYNGIGWLGFNNLSDGGAVNYGVNLPVGNGDLSGYAWSEHYGWISFNTSDLSGCPSGTCTASVNNGTLSGWARILAIRDAAIVGNSGGWSGWVSLAGTAQDGSSYGATISGTTLSGYIWSDELGWMDLSASFPGSGVFVATPPTYGICPPGLSNLDTITGSSNHTGNFRLWKRTDGVSVDCLNTVGATDITALPTTSWSSVNPSVATVDNAGSKGLVTAVSGGTTSLSTNISVTDNATPAGMAPVIVTGCYVSSCSTLPSSITDKYCPNQPFSASDGCGGTLTNCATGTRYCDFNWKEVAP